MKRRMKAWLALGSLLLVGLIGVTLYQRRAVQPTRSTPASSFSQPASSEAPVVTPAYTVSEAEKAYLSKRFAPLLAINPETIGYIYAPGTMLDEPIVQTNDNETYLDKTFDGGYQPEMGTVFMDVDNSPHFDHRLTWLFGHARGANVPDSRMFNDVNYYDQQDFFDAHPYVVIETPERKFYYEAQMMIIVPETTPFFRVDFDSDADFLQQLEAVKAGAQVKRANLTLNPKDRYLVLSTCRQDDVTIRANLYLRQIPDEELIDFLAQHEAQLAYKATR